MPTTHKYRSQKHIENNISSLPNILINFKTIKEMNKIYKNGKLYKN